jgi:hypothetical protein
VKGVWAISLEGKPDTVHLCIPILDRWHPAAQRAGCNLQKESFLAAASRAASTDLRVATRSKTEGHGRVNRQKQAIRPDR